MIEATDLAAIGTARLEAIRDGLLQASIAIRSIPDTTVLRGELGYLTVFLDTVSSELRSRPEALRAKRGA